MEDDRFAKLTEREKRLLTNVRSVEIILQEMWFDLAALRCLADPGSDRGAAMKMATHYLQQQVEIILVKIERIPVEHRP